jgi:two-component system, NtrC family, nitrogen regulation response regulator NtrX
MNQTGKILIVDDEEPLRKGARLVLAQEGYEVLTAKEGGGTLNFAATQLLNVAIVDKQMPRMDGLEVIRRLKKLQPRILSIVLTAHGYLHDAVDVGKLGACDYLAKPLTDANRINIGRRTLYGRMQKFGLK